MEFTGNKDINEKILQSLNDTDLAQFCKSGAAKNICASDDFWMRRTFKRFDNVFPVKEELVDFKNKSGLTWRNYYMEIYYKSTSDTEKMQKNRLDFQKLGKYIDQNTEKLQFSDKWDNARVELIDEFLSEDFINPNMLIMYIFDNIEDEELAGKMLRRLTGSGDRRLSKEGVRKARKYVIDFIGLTRKEFDRNELYLF